MILWVFIEFFGVKIVITDILPIFTDILLIFHRYLSIFFQKFQHKCACSTVAIFQWKIGIFQFSAKNRRFYQFFPDFSSDQFFLCFFFSVPAENRLFGDISVEKTDFFVPGQNLDNGLTIDNLIQILETENWWLQQVFKRHNLNTKLHTRLNTEK